MGGCVHAEVDGVSVVALGNGGHGDGDNRNNGSDGNGEVLRMPVTMVTGTLLLEVTVVMRAMLGVVMIESVAITAMKESMVMIMITISLQVKTLEVFSYGIISESLLSHLLLSPGEKTPNQSSVALEGRR